MRHMISAVEIIFGPVEIQRLDVPVSVLCGEGHQCSVHVHRMKGVIILSPLEIWRLFPALSVLCGRRFRCCMVEGSGAVW